MRRYASPRALRSLLDSVADKKDSGRIRQIPDTAELSDPSPNDIFVIMSVTSVEEKSFRVGLKEDR